jgi:hypothetical protein
MILKLEQMEIGGDRPAEPKYLYVNTAHIMAFSPYLEGCQIDLVGAHFTEMGPTNVYWVAIAPDELAAAIDPENACPEGGPARCGYQEYLAYRKDGESDLSHGGYHGAVKIAEQHGRCCKVYENGRICPTCQRNEQRIRA